MQALIILLILILACGEYVTTALGLPTIFRFLPEAISGIFVIYVVFAGTRNQFRLVAQKYWLAVGALAVVMLCGIANNPSGAGPMLSAARLFFRAVPLFFLPAVLPQTDSQLLRQMKLLLGVAVLQLPIAAFQRWTILDAGRYSGDDVRGTMLDSGILSMFQICAVLLVTGMMLKGRIGKVTYAILFFVLLIPTAINETKATVVFLPIGLLVTLVLGSDPRQRLRFGVVGLLGLMMFGAIFVPVYNKMEEFNPVKKQRDLTNYFTDQKALSRYMSGNVTGVGTKMVVRRGDAIVVPLQYVSKDPVTLAFGLGLGSVSPSNFGKNFEGEYFDLFKRFIITSFTYFILEVGAFGMIIIGFLFWLVFQDSLQVARKDETLVGALAAGWSGVVALFATAVMYNCFYQFASVTYLYAYFSGVICARAVALQSRPAADQPAAKRAEPTVAIEELALRRARNINP
jgi:hypothetical protein